VLEAEVEEGEHLAVKSGLSGYLDFGGIHLAVFESPDPFDVYVVCRRKYAAWVFY